MLAEIETGAVLVKFLPQIALIAAISSLIGWILRGKTAKPAAAKSPASAENAPRERVKNLENALERAKTTHRTLKAEFDSLQATAVPSDTVEKLNAELATAKKVSETESKRASALETDLKRAQETIKSLNSRNNDADKANKDRRFTLENELSKARQELAILQERPDNTTELQAEIDRLRESVAVSSRYAGEMRKRESLAAEALEKAQALLAQTGDTPRPAASRKVGPVVPIESDRVAAAKAEVLRLIERNKQTPVPALPAFEMPEQVAACPLNPGADT